MRYHQGVRRCSFLLPWFSEGELLPRLHLMSNSTGASFGEALASLSPAEHDARALIPRGRHFIFGIEYTLFVICISWLATFSRIIIWRADDFWRNISSTTNRSGARIKMIFSSTWCHSTVSWASYQCRSNGMGMGCRRREMEKSLLTSAFTEAEFTSISTRSVNEVMPFSAGERNRVSLTTSLFEKFLSTGRPSTPSRKFLFQ